MKSHILSIAYVEFQHPKKSSMGQYHSLGQPSHQDNIEAIGSSVVNRIKVTKFKMSYCPNHSA